MPKTSEVNVQATSLNTGILQAIARASKPITGEDYVEAFKQFIQSKNQEK